jgi:hypothetical protein
MLNSAGAQITFEAKLSVSGKNFHVCTPHLASQRTGLLYEAPTALKKFKAQFCKIKNNSNTIYNNNDIIRPKF